MRPREHHVGGQHLAGTLIGVDHVDAAPHRGRLEHLTLLEQDHELLEQSPDDSGLTSRDGDLVPPYVHVDVWERILDEPQQLVLGAEETGHQVVAGDVDVDGGVGHLPRS
jgi:hypothetical protein